MNPDEVLHSMPWERLMESAIATKGCHPAIKAELRRRLKREAAMTARLIETTEGFTESFIQEALGKRETFLSDFLRGRIAEAEATLDVAFKAEAAKIALSYIDREGLGGTAYRDLNAALSAYQHKP